MKFNKINKCTQELYLVVDGYKRVRSCAFDSTITDIFHNKNFLFVFIAIVCLSIWSIEFKWCYLMFKYLPILCGLISEAKISMRHAFKEIYKCSHKINRNLGLECVQQPKSRKIKYTLYYILFVSSNCLEI